MGEVKTLLADESVVNEIREQVPIPSTQTTLAASQPSRIVAIAL